MKKTSLFLFLTMSALPSTLSAHPFRTRFVCVPEVAPDQMALEFKVRDSGQCVEGERYLQVTPQSDGSVLLLPVQESLTPEQARDLERYRRYFGGQGGSAN